MLPKKPPGSSLTPRQKGILIDLAQVREHRRSTITAHDSLSDREQKDLKKQYLRYERVMVQACHAGLDRHPLVRGWVASRRAHGEWDVLRRARVGLEKGVKRPIPTGDLELWARIRELQGSSAGGNERRTLEAIRRLLIEQGAIPRMTQQPFNKLVTRLNTVEGSLTVTAGQKKTIYRFPEGYLGIGGSQPVLPLYLSVACQREVKPGIHRRLYRNRIGPGAARAPRGRSNLGAAGVRCLQSRPPCGPSWERLSEREEPRRVGTEFAMYNSSSRQLIRLKLRWVTRRFFSLVPFDRTEFGWTKGRPGESGRPPPSGSGRI